MLAAADEDIGLETDLHQLADGVLRGLGLQLARRRDEGDQGEVDDQGVVAADLLAELPDGLEEREGLDVAHGATDLGDHHVVSRRGAPIAFWSSVMWGMTWTVLPRYSPRRSLLMTV